MSYWIRYEQAGVSMAAGPFTGEPWIKTAKQQAEQEAAYYASIADFGRVVISETPPQEHGFDNG